MALDDQVKLAFTAVTDLTKQLITLATAVLTLEAGFAKAFVEKAVERHWQGSASWLALLLSVAAGVWTLMAIAGTLSADKAVSGKSVYGANIRVPAFMQVVLFLGGLTLSMWFGTLASR